LNIAYRMFAVGAAALLLGLSGCANAPRPKSSTAAARDCSELAAARERAQEQQRAAHQKEHGAWKAVIPVAVAARYASARSQAAAADERLAEANAAAEHQGCLHAAR
jgi:hypothetical protein